jgi:hypothetical protein
MKVSKRIIRKEKSLVTIQTDWSNEKSISDSEKKQKKLYKQGYQFFECINGRNGSAMVYCKQTIKTR